MWREASEHLALSRSQHGIQKKQNECGDQWHRNSFEHAQNLNAWLSTPYCVRLRCKAKGRDSKFISSVLWEHTRHSSSLQILSRNSWNAAVLPAVPLSFYSRLCKSARLASWQLTSTFEDGYGMWQYVVPMFGYFHSNFPAAKGVKLTYRCFSEDTEQRCRNLDLGGCSVTGCDTGSTVTVCERSTTESPFICLNLFHDFD